MAYGLRIYSADNSADPIFDSTDAFGFIELQDSTVAETGTSTASYNVIVDDGYTDLYMIYSPSYVNPDLGSSNSHLVDNTLTPIFTVNSRTDNGNGTATFNASLSWKGQVGGGGNNRIGGGRVLMFGR